MHFRGEWLPGGWCAVTKFAEWIGQELERRGLNQSQLAARIGLGSSAVNGWFTKGAIPGPRTCVRLAEFLHLPPEDVLQRAGHLPAPRDARDDPRPRERRLAGLATEIDDDGLDLLCDIAEQVLKRHPRRPDKG